MDTDRDPASDDRIEMSPEQLAAAAGGLGAIPVPPPTDQWVEQDDEPEPDDDIEVADLP